MIFRRLRHYFCKRAVGIFLVATIFLSTLSFFIFDLYVSSVGKEIIGSWLQSEAVSIQEGNLLTSITKNQRVLLSSRFVRGMKLIDTSTTPTTDLIAFGAPFEIGKSALPGKTADLVVARDGFLQKQTLYRVPGRPELILASQVRSDFLIRWFFGLVAVLIGFLLVVITTIRRAENREAILREKFLKRALSEMVLTEQSSVYIQREYPFLAKWWDEKRAELESNRRLTAANEKNAALGELAARLAHDIRSPLNTLESVSESVIKTNPEHERLFKMAVKRLREITGGIMTTYKVKSKESTPLLPSKPTVIFLPLIVDELIEEKEAQYKDKNLKITAIKGTNHIDAILKGDAGEIKRHLSNLIDNAAEASMDRPSDGVIEVMTLADENCAILQVKDNGLGLPKELSSQVGNKGFTFGKKNGSGLGVHFLKEAVQKAGGHFRFESTHGVGSTVTVEIPRDHAQKINSIDLKDTDTILILDDDASIHEAWRQKFESEKITIPVEHAFDPESAANWLKVTAKEKKVSVLTDFELNHTLNGLEFIEENRRHMTTCLLVTSSHSDKSVLDGCEGLHVSLLPKPFLSQVKFNL